MVYFAGNKFFKFCVSISKKQIYYLVHTLFLTDSQNFNHTKYSPYMVIMPYSIYSVTKNVVGQVIHNVYCVGATHAKVQGN